MSNPSPKRLIEVAFPLKQTSIESVHEKMCHAGHPKALHIWPARRPLAACRAALIGTLLPDPGDPEERKMILEKMGGRVVQKVKKKKDAEGRTVEEITEETEGGILHWGRENGPDLDWFRQKIREAYGGRAPKVLDPFAGGGAIPLEAMRLGCEATAVDINPVAWFILKCTLEYPQKLTGQKLLLPDFVFQDREFLTEFFKGLGFKSKEMDLQLEKFGFGKSLSQQLPGLDSEEINFEADFVWHAKAWSNWVFRKAYEELKPYYPSVAGNPTIAYLWARTVTCKNCRIKIPLIKSKWIVKKENKRILLKLTPTDEKNGVRYEIINSVPQVGKTLAERRSYDKLIGMGTMSRSGVSCPCCGSTSMTMDDIRLEGRAGNISQELIAIVVNHRGEKQFIAPDDVNRFVAGNSQMELDRVFNKLPYGRPNEKLPGKEALGFRIPLYGYDEWQKMFTPRQLLCLGTFSYYNHLAVQEMLKSYPSEWTDAILSYLICVLNKVADYNSAFVAWQPKGSKGSNTFQRWALPMKWDFVENNILESDSGGWKAVTTWVTEPLENSLFTATKNALPPNIIQQSSIDPISGSYDVIITDPPYYDAIPYSDLMDFFYVWIRRNAEISPRLTPFFNKPLSPKWNRETSNGELIDDESRHNGNSEQSRLAYENGMFTVFENCYQVLSTDGKLVVVFAHKNPTAWEALVSAIIRAGFIVDGSWPIQTEMGNRTRSQSSSALSSSVWLVCKKRHVTTRPGWDNKVLEEMRANIHTQLHDFWDAGIRGPDFVWAATGPALEAYSQYPVVKKANNPGEVMIVSEFLIQVRRMVVDFVVGRVLSEAGNGGEEISGLDAVTTYYLLHRHDFGLNDAPAGPCILYAVSCGLSDKDLADRFDLLARRGGKENEEPDETDDEEGEAEGSGSSFRLKAWNQRKNPRMGYDPATDGSAEKLPLFPDLEREVQPSREIPLIDQIHRLMHLWKSGDVSKVNEYLDLRGARRNPLFHQLLQALIELAPAGSEERSLLESISNHVGGEQTTAQKLFN